MIFVPDVLGWMQKPCHHVGLCELSLPGMCFLDWLMLTTHSPLECFSAMEWLAFSCLAVCARHCPLPLTVFLNRRRELDQVSMSTSCWADLGQTRQSPPLLPGLQGTYRKWNNMQPWTTWSPYSFGSDCGPSYPTKTNLILVGCAGNTSDSWNCCFETVNREFLMYLYCAIFFSFFFFSL